MLRPNWYAKRGVTEPPLPPLQRIAALLLCTLTIGVFATGGMARPPVAHGLPCNTCNGNGMPPQPPTIPIPPTLPTPPMVAFHLEWWGWTLSLDRRAGCFAAKGVPGLNAILLMAVPPPWSAVVI